MALEYDAVEGVYGTEERDRIVSSLIKLLEEAQSGATIRRPYIGDILKLRSTTLATLNSKVFSQVSLYGSRVLTPRTVVSTVLRDLQDAGFNIEDSVIVLGYDVDVCDCSIKTVKYVPVICRGKLVSISPRPVGLTWRVVEYCEDGKPSKIRFPIYREGGTPLTEDLCPKCDKFLECGGRKYSPRRCRRYEEHVPAYLVEIGVESRSGVDVGGGVQCLALPHVVNILLETCEGTLFGVFIDREVTRRGYEATEPILLLLDVLQTRRDRLDQYRTYLISRGYYILGGTSLPEIDVDLVAESLDPELVGILPQKILTLLQLVGAYSDEFTGFRDGAGKRCTIHELHVGVPGTGKSSLYTAVKRLVRKCIIVSLTSSTVAGLFISGKDEVRYGGAVIVSSRDPQDFGILVLEEVDTARELERDSGLLSQLLTFMEQGMVARDVAGRHIEVRSLNCAVTMIANVRKIVGRAVTLSDLLPTIFATPKGEALLDRVDVVVFYPPPTVEQLEKYVESISPATRSVDARGVLDPELLEDIITRARRARARLSEDFVSSLKSEVSRIVNTYTSAGLRSSFVSYRIVDKVVRLCIALAKLEYAIGKIPSPTVTSRHLSMIKSVLEAMMEGALQSFAGEDPLSAIPEGIRNMARGLPYPKLGMLVLELLSNSEDGLTVREIYEKIRDRCTACRALLEELLNELGLSSLDPKALKDAIRTVLERLNMRGDVVHVGGYGEDAKFRTVQ